MSDFADDFIEVHSRAIEQPDFNPRRAAWRIDMSSWSLVVKTRFGALSANFGMPGDTEFMGFPVTLVVTKELPEFADMDISPSSAVERQDPPIICLAYEGKYGFLRYVISPASDAAFLPFDTTGTFIDTTKAQDGDGSATSTSGGDHG